MSVLYRESVLKYNTWGPFQPNLYSGRFIQSRLPRTVSRWLLKISTYRDSTVPLGNLLQWLITNTGIKLFFCLNSILYFSLCPCCLICDRAPSTRVWFCFLYSPHQVFMFYGHRLNLLQQLSCCLMQPRLLLVFWVTNVYYCLMVSLVFIRLFESSSTKLLSSQSVPSLYWCLEIFIPRHWTWHFLWASHDSLPISPAFQFPS